MPGRKDANQYYFHTLLGLLKLGAKYDYVKISTKEIGERLGVTQQAASFQLKELERLDLISKKRVGKYLAVKISDRGLSSLATVYFELKEILEGSEFSFHGKAFHGLGQGAFYISMPKFKNQFVKLLGFEPFPGTLNVRLYSPIEIHFSRLLRSTKEGIEIREFEDIKSQESFGPLKCFRVTVNDSLEGAVVFTDKTHYNDSVLEIISPHQLRKKLSSDDVVVKVFADFMKKNV
ncbi:MAG: DUF120 domain-containing protein [Nitrososphaerota archaeon]|nr:DUF120 domain-containing protein [Nitrososphaerota archaeon]